MIDIKSVMTLSVIKRIKNMSKQMYTPQPIDTTDVKLPEELEQLVEQRSKNVHEVWAETRIKQGWKYGEQRNDELKTHPCIVPYEDLPEEEKEYDRNTSIGTLKLIIIISCVSVISYLSSALCI